MLKETISLLVLAFAFDVMSAILAAIGFARSRAVCWPWMAVFVGSLAAAIGCVIPVYVAISTGLYDFQGALLTALAALAWQIAVWGFLVLTGTGRKAPPQ